MLESTARKGDGGTFSRVPGDVKSLIAVLSANSFCYSFLMIYLTAYLPERGVGSNVIGLIITIQGVALVVAGIPLGILSDRRGRKWILICGAIGLSPLLIVFALTTNTTILIAVSFAAGIAESGFMSTVNAIIADKTPLEGRDAAFSLSFIFGTMSYGFGSSIPFLFPYFESSLKVSSLAIHTNILIVFGVVNLIAPFAFWWILRNYKEERHSTKINWRGKSMRTLYKFSGINSIIGLGAGLIIPLIPLWLLLKFGIQDTYSGPLLAISSITMALAGFLSPRIARKYGSVRAIALTESLSTVFMISLAFIGNPVLAATIYILRAAMMNMASPLADSYLMRIVSPEERGLASSINSVIWRLPNSVTTYIGGIILASGNYSLPFLLGAGLYILSITLFYSVFRNFKPAS